MGGGSGSRVMARVLAVAGRGGSGSRLMAYVLALAVVMESGCGNGSGGEWLWQRQWT